MLFRSQNLRRRDELFHQLLLHNWTWSVFLLFLHLAFYHLDCFRLLLAPFQLWVSHFHTLPFVCLLQVSCSGGVPQRFEIRRSTGAALVHGFIDDRTEMWALMNRRFRGLSNEKIVEPKKEADEVPGELASMNWLCLIGLALPERGRWQKQW